MKVAFVNQPWNLATPRVQSGSIALITHNLAKRLADSCEVIVYARQRQPGARREKQGRLEYRYLSMVEDWPPVRLLERSVKLRRLLAARLLDKVFDKVRLHFWSSSYYLSFIARVAMQLRAERCDVIHLHNLSQFPVVVRRFNPQAVIVLHMNCEWLTQVDQQVIARRLRSVDLVLGCSRYITDEIRRGYPEHAERCRTLYNGIDLRGGETATQVTRDGESPNVLFVGRVSPEKGVHVLLEAFRLVVQRYPRARLTVVGPENVPEWDAVVGVSNDPLVKGLARFYGRSYVAQLRAELPPELARQVVFAGNVPHEELARYYRDADLFACPSVWEEPFGMVPVEAMAAGLAVVATRSGGIPESVEDGRTGLLVERGNAAALAKAMLWLLESKDLRRRMGEIGRARALKWFSWDRIAEELQGFYAEALVRRRLVRRKSA